MALQNPFHSVSNDDSLHKDVSMELNDYQQLYIQTIYDYFREKADWPSFKQVERKIQGTYPDFRMSDEKYGLADIESLITYDPDRNLNDLAIIGFRSIPLCEGSEQDVNDFLKALRYCTAKCLNINERKVEVTSEELQNALQLSSLSARKIRWLFVFESFVRVHDISPAFIRNWKLTIDKNEIVRYDGVNSVDDYLSRKYLPVKKNRFNDPAPIIGKVARTNPADIQATTANLMQIDNSYYMNALLQSQRSFFWALIGAGVGVAFFIAAVFILIFRQPISQSYVAALITASSGGVVEIIAGIILVLHQRASDQANQCHERLNRIQRFLVSMSHCETLEGDLKQTTRAKLMEKLND